MHERGGLHPVNYAYSRKYTRGDGEQTGLFPGTHTYADPHVLRGMSKSFTGLLECPSDPILSETTPRDDLISLGYTFFVFLYGEDALLWFLVDLSKGEPSLL